MIFQVGNMQDIISALEDRRVKLGKAMYQELTGIKKPVLDNNKILHWPVVLLYAEVMSSDIIEDFCETDMFFEHLDMISLSYASFLVKVPVNLNIVIFLLLSSNESNC